MHMHTVGDVWLEHYSSSDIVIMSMHAEHISVLYCRDIVQLTTVLTGNIRPSIVLFDNTASITSLLI